MQHSDNIVPVTSGRKVFRAVPVQSGDIDSAGVSIASDQDIPPDTQVQFLSPKSAKSNDDSLTYSEDSDTTRIYNLNTRETQIVPPTEAERVETPIESPVKLATQFFNSPRKFQAIRRMDDDITTVIRTSNHNLMNGASVSVQLTVKSLANALNGKSFPSGSRRAGNLRGEASNRTRSNRQPPFREEAR